MNPRLVRLVERRSREASPPETGNLKLETGDFFMVFFALFCGRVAERVSLLSPALLLRLRRRGRKQSRATVSTGNVFRPKDRVPELGHDFSFTSFNTYTHS